MATTNPPDSKAFTSPAERAALIGVTGVATTLAFNWLAILIGRRQLRSSVVTAIRSDIRSIVQALHLTSTVKSFVVAASMSDPEAFTPTWNDTPRDENYFKLYESIAPQIGTLPPDLAREVVRFYTFLHVSRDAAKPLTKARENNMDLTRFHVHAANILIALKEVLGAAALVLDRRYSANRSSDDGTKLALSLRAEVEEGIKLLETRYNHSAPQLSEA